MIRAATPLEVALEAYQETWIKLENERGEYIRVNERHILAMEAALKAAKEAAR